MLRRIGGMKYYAAHNGVAAVYDERGEAIAFDTAADVQCAIASLNAPATVVSKRPYNFYWADRMSCELPIVARDRHGRVIYDNTGANYPKH